jgi:hypothetical protein
MGSGAIRLPTGRYAGLFLNGFGPGGSGPFLLLRGVEEAQRFIPSGGGCMQIDFGATFCTLESRCAGRDKPTGREEVLRFLPTGHPTPSTSKRADRWHHLAVRPATGPAQTQCYALWLIPTAPRMFVQSIPTRRRHPTAGGTPAQAISSASTPAARSSPGNGFRVLPVPERFCMTDTAW